MALYILALTLAGDFRVCHYSSNKNSKEMGPCELWKASCEKQDSRMNIHLKHLNSPHSEAIIPGILTTSYS